jgi:transcriptional regulator with XRE-family HTH domain
MSAEDLAQMVPYSREMISKIEKGARRVAKDMRGKLGRAVDKARFYKALQAEATGNVMVLPVLDIERHRLVAKELFMLEMAEVREELESDEMRRLFLRTHPKDRAKVEALLVDGLKFLAAGETMYIVLAESYGISLSAMYDRLQEILVAEDLIGKKPEKEEAPKRRSQK